MRVKFLICWVVKIYFKIEDKIGNKEIGSKIELIKIKKNFLEGISI